MALKWNFERGWGVQAKKTSMGGVCIFSGTTQSYGLNWEATRMFNTIPN